MSFHIFKGIVQHWYLEIVHAHYNPVVFKNYIMKLTCESVIKIGAYIFEENDFKKLLDRKNAGWQLFVNLPTPHPPPLPPPPNKMYL